MLKLMIVDDEPIIRKGLRYYIDWKEYGVEVICEASNGKEALTSLYGNTPDIIITDIRMPLMDGIDFTIEVRKLLPDVKIIMLTGYDDREYLTKAISMGINEYVFKSADSTQIIEAVKKVSKAIKSERQKEAITKEKNRLLDSGYLCLSANYMLEILQGNKIQFTKQCLENMDVKLDGPEYLLFYLSQIENKDIQNEIMSLIYFNLAQYTPFAIMIDDKIVGILNVEQNSYDDCINKLNSKIANQYSPIIISNPINSLELARKEYEDILNAAKRRFWFIDKKIIVARDIVKKSEEAIVDFNLLLKSEKAIIDDFKSGRVEDAKEKMFKYFETLEASYSPVEILIEATKRVITWLCSYLNIYEKLAKYFSQLETVSSREEIFNIVLEILSKVERETPQSSTVIKAVSIIDKNYNKKITLESIANEIYISPSYLSKVFKEEIGIGIKEYINSIRIQKAKILIKNGDVKISEVANIVGFRDYKQFSAYFSRFENMSASDYKRLLRG